MISIYIHIPFCLSKCHYCDFFSLGWGKAPIPEENFLEALRQEWRQRRQGLAPSALEPVPTVFFGGGTPSLLSPDTIGKILEEIPLFPWERGRGEGKASPRFREFPPVTEVTLELNPKTADRKKLEGFKQVGVSRVSMGLQSLDDQILEKLGRAHSAQEALESLQLALETGFTGVNVDIMYGLPYQDLKNLKDTLAGLSSYPLTHLSAYELILEEHTPFFTQYRYDRKPLPDTETLLQMRSAIEGFTKEKGMELYEISNWARPGAQCRHNLRYWDYESFLGLGAGAVSFLKWDQLGAGIRNLWKGSQDEIPYGLRWTNPKDLKRYLERPGDLNPESLEWISHKTAQTEFMMMGLRKAEGIRYEDFQKKFKVPFPNGFFQAVKGGIGRGWIREKKGGVALTEMGRQFSNEVIQEFL
jgi:oxygen-independent coproporphyrinogen-3 oxidase